MVFSSNSKGVPNIYAKRVRINLPTDNCSNSIGKLVSFPTLKSINKESRNIIKGIINNQLNFIRWTSKMCAKSVSLESNTRPQVVFSLPSGTSIFTNDHWHMQNSLSPSFAGINLASLASCKAPFPNLSLLRQKLVFSPRIFI